MCAHFVQLHLYLIIDTAPFVHHLFQNDIKVHILNMGISDNTPTGQLIFTIFSAFAFELKKQGITYKMIEGKTGVSIAIQKRRFKKYKNNIHFN